MRRKKVREILMSAYLVFTREKTLNQAEMDIYHEKLRATLAGYNVKLLASYGPHDAHEGSPPEGTVIA